ncbi:MAG: tol-pal system protein YbgF [Rhodospirillaceae bacterium]
MMTSSIKLYFFALSAVFFLSGTCLTSVYAQAPLDIRLINDRLDRIEKSLRDTIALPSSEAITPSMQIPLQGPNTGQQTLPSDVAGRLQVRILQLERLVETLTGQMEITEFEVSRLRAQFQQMSSDVGYRLALLEQAAGISPAVAALQQAPRADNFQMTRDNVTAPETMLVQNPLVQPGSQGVSQTSGMSSSPLAVINDNGRIEPDLNMPISAPVQPQPQIFADRSAQSGSTLSTPASKAIAKPKSGSLNPSIDPVQPDPGTTFGVIRTDAEGQALPPLPGAAARPTQSMPQQPIAPPAIATVPSPGVVGVSRIGTVPDPLAAMVALPDGTPKEQYDYAFDILRKADYGRAEKALRIFLEVNPEDTLAGNAQYWLGETFYVRGDFEQAAVEFLSGYQAYPNGIKAPDNLLKLGLSMAQLGQSDGACTALSRLATEYPEANDTIRRRAQTERARLSCS